MTEQATFIAQLNPQLPDGSESVGGGDDHLRMIKQVLLNTFPGASRPFRLGGWAEKDAAVRDVASDVSLTLSDDGRWIVVDASAGAVTVTLPSLVSGVWVGVVKTDSTANAVTVSGGGATVDGRASVALSAPYEAALFVGGSSEWHMPLHVGAREFYLRADVLSNDGGPGAGPDLVLNRNSSDPATSPLGRLRWLGNDAAGNDQEYARLDGAVDDPTDGAEAARLRFHVARGGTLAEEMWLGGGLRAPGRAAQGAGTVNVDRVYERDLPVGLPELVTVTANTALAAGHQGAVVKVTADGVTVTLPPSGTLPAGWTVTVWNAAGAAAGNVAVAPASGDAFLGGQAQVRVCPVEGWNRAVFEWDGAKWRVRSWRWASAEVAVQSGAAAYTAAHGLGAVPQRSGARLRCKTAELGFSVGDEVEVWSVGTGSNNVNGQVVADAANVGVYTRGTPNLTRKDTLVATVVTPANWRWVLWAEHAE